jgi:O-acetyl-ADP-ribose deacetylase (regulator of RNase III)
VEYPLVIALRRHPAPDIPGDQMSFGVSSSDPDGALREFCALLKRLHDEAGGPKVAALGLDPAFPLRRTQIHATLAGTISGPPSKEFVQEFVQRCVGYATTRKVRLRVPTDLEEWNFEHKYLLRLWRGRDRCTACAQGPPVPRPGRNGAPLSTQTITLYPVNQTPGGPDRTIGIITGTIRRVHCANVWVNSENSEMEMARIHDFSISAIIRYEGARRDAAQHVEEDRIAEELEAKVAGARPLAPGAVVVTGSGELERRNGVRYVIHVAAVQGEPGSGYRPMREIGRCVDNALAMAEGLVMPDGKQVSILFPLLGTGTGGGDVAKTATQLTQAAVNYLRSTAVTQVATVFFLAFTDQELRACKRALKDTGLRPAL